MYINNYSPIIESAVQITTLEGKGNSERTYEGFSSQICSLDWETDSIHFNKGEWVVVQGTKTSLQDLESYAHEAFVSTISTKEKVEIYQKFTALFQEEGHAWAVKPSLISTVSDEYTTLNIAVPLSAISSWHFIRQLYSGGYSEEKSTHISIQLPPGYTIDAFEKLLTPIDPKIEEIPFENFLYLCELASYMGATTLFINTNIYEASIENIALLSRSTATPGFLHYKAITSSIISQYFLKESVIQTAIDHLEQIEGFTDWAREFPLDLNLNYCNKISELNSHSLSLIGDLFPSTISLKITHSEITYLPNEFAKIEIFITHWCWLLNDIHVLDHSKHLRVLEILGSHISSIPSGCTSLKIVTLQDCYQVTSLQPLDGSSSLKELTLNTVDVHSVPKDCTALESVKIYGLFSNNLDLSPLNHSSTLTTLHVEDFFNPIDFPKDCNKLSKVTLSRGRITSLSTFGDSLLFKQLIIKNMPYLKYLPSNCYSLEEISLLNCPNVQDLSSLDGSQTLRRLVFADQIPNIRLPLNCPHLKIEAKEVEDGY